MDHLTKNYEEFAKKIGVAFKDIALLREAFTHRSYLNEHRSTGLKHNERFEFLGDAVLELVITEYLFEKYPEEPEGKLTAYRSALVNTNSISDAATEWGMNDYLLLSRGEAKDVGRASGARAATTVHVGDYHEIDVVGARAAGIRAVLIDPAGLHADRDCPRFPSLPAFAGALLG